MAGLKLIQSNRLEALSGALAGNLGEPLSSPLAPEIIVVQSRGMQRWLSMELARLHGVCANVRWPFPNAFVLDMFSRVLAGRGQAPLFNRETLAFRIMDVLPGMLEEEGFGSIRNYLAEDRHGLKLYQLSTALADIFDQYVVFRPDMVLGWEEGASQGSGRPGPVEGWQAVLWNRIIQGMDSGHRARLRKEFFRALRESAPSGLPERASVFGISYLPPFHLEVLKTLSSIMDIGIYVLNPCREYWGDIVSEQRITRIESGKPAGDELHLETGNELLACLGMLGRNFLDMVLDLEPEETDLYVEPGRRTMLEGIQGDILNLTAAGENGPRTAGAGDRSIQVHSCHSPMREVEVLQDTLLRLFEEIGGLSPRDILVMAPDIEAYAPFIRAVFDLPGDDRRTIPYSISDRSLRQSSKLTDAFLAVLDLPAQRYEASLVLDLLEREPVRRRFGISGEDMRKVRLWVMDANIRWGRDGKDRQSCGLPGFEENTWSFGIKRLLLGYAMSPDSGALFEGIAPYGNMDPALSGILGNFIEFTDRLFSLVEELKRERDLAAWSGLLLKAVDELFDPDDDGLSDLLKLKSVIRSLAKTGKDSLCSRSISVDVLREHMAGIFGSPAEGFGFLEQGVTFCSMLPMRSIPFRVICLLGMNHESFPRRDFSGGLDIMAMDPRRGDRSRRDDDLYLFLEALLSAREVFCISYVGQGIQDNAPIPPSVVVSSLLEYLDKAFAREGKPAGGEAVTHHCLQAFNPKYFRKDTGLFSYSPDNARGAQALRTRSRETGQSGSLGEPDEGLKKMDLQRFIRFFGNPAEFFLRNRLAAAFPAADTAVEDREPFELGGLERYETKERLLAEFLDGGDAAAYRALLKAEGSLPHGMPGEMVFREIASEIRDFIPLIRKYTGEGRIVREDLAMELNGFALTGYVDTAAGGYIRFRHADITAEDLLRAWICHLLLHAVRPGLEIRSFHLGREKIAFFKPVEDAGDCLGLLLELYGQGLEKPLCFFPRSSYAYADHVFKKKDHERGLRDAYLVWTGNSGRTRAEGDSSAYYLCFPDGPLFGDEFADLAQRVYGPLLEHLEVRKA